MQAETSLGTSTLPTLRWQAFDVSSRQSPYEFEYPSLCELRMSQLNSSRILGDQLAGYLISMSGYEL